ncbi:LOW QUALITY PROTEIN: hypothetical protein OSB04_016066 [Centaurea solstitialis]|uniref:TIR domain-containing protein n=1 Tax=Centaurea solstitialis TaxID=347529 RepID=A0AA38WKP9_9ASTR|nr:LOW QUALITY PROTEIN: hypothetical protein OSB04_016066 [Centaurea solstitialis]
MASTSSSSIIASPSANYDIFLSFRGEDTRHSFTDHLYDALNRAGISTFRDDDEIDRGEELKPEIEKAIIASKGSIVVLSKSYANSTWCLDELWLILERRREFDHFVLPVFYHVEPSHVRKQDDTFKIEVKASSKWTDDNVKRWREALTKVAELSETEFLKEIIAKIYYKVGRKIVNLPRNLIGMNARDKDINSWLQSNVKVLAICGMGGSGKTTFAKYIVSSKCQHFEIISVVEDISGTFQKQNNFNELIQKFAKDITGDQKNMPTTKFLLDHAYKLLKKKKAFIVFDDIDEPKQLEHFLKFEDIHEESKIIITTRKNNTNNWFKPRTWGYREYKMRLLDVDESVELFSLHAFGLKIPVEGYEDLTKEVLQYCEGNPLALEVLGSSLSEDVSIPFWINTLDLLKREINFDIQHVLIRSYDSLPNKNSKELFLHIACFFVGEDKDYVEQILEHDYCASSGIQVLINRCLLFVSPNNKLMMHQLIQEMGKSIICQESKWPVERSRSWLSSDSYKILRKGESSKTDSLRKMDNLKFLKLNDVHLTGSYEDFSEDLRWLRWHRFSLTAIPSGLFQGNLVTIDMRDNKLEIFEPPIVLPFLKTLDLQGSMYLSEIHNISRLPNLETLILYHCSKLVRGCESIGGLMNLCLIKHDRVLCWNFESANIKLKASTSGGGGSQQISSFSLPHSLVWLSLRDCYLSCSEFFPLSFSVELKLQYLDLGGGWFESLPSYKHLKDLRVLDLSLCYYLKQLLCLPSALAELYVYCCTSLEKITFESHEYTLQEFGYEGCGKLCEIEGFIKLVSIAKLDETDLGHMAWLKEYQDHEISLIGDIQFTYGRSQNIQMLYEFGIMSTSLPDIKDANMIYEYMSESPSVCFSVPSCTKNKRLIGLNESFKYTISGNIDDPTWFVKIRASNGVDYMYNPHVFGDAGEGKVGIWLSFWPIGSKLVTGEEVNVSIVVFNEIMKVQECGASLVYVDDDETLKNNTQWNLSAFQLITGAFYLCRRDFFMLMEVGRLTPGWLSILVGVTIDDTEVRGWRKTGRPYLSDSSLSDLPVSSLTELSFPSRADPEKSEPSVNCPPMNRA